MQHTTVLMSMSGPLVACCGTGLCSALGCRLARPQAQVGVSEQITREELVKDYIFFLCFTYYLLVAKAAVKITGTFRRLTWIYTTHPHPPPASTKPSAL